MTKVSIKNIRSIINFLEANELIEKKDYLNIKVISKKYRGDLLEKVVNSMVAKGDSIRQEKKYSLFSR